MHSNTGAMHAPCTGAMRLWLISACTLHMPFPGQPASCFLTNLVQAVSVLSQGAAGGSGSDSGTQTAGGDRWGADEIHCPFAK